MFLERGYTWGLDIIGGRGSARPEATASVAGGRYCLAVPRAGLWKVVVRAPGFVALSYSPLPVTRSKELPPVRLPPAGGIRVVVRSAGGAPASGVWVVAKAAEPAFWSGMVAEGWRPELRFGRTDREGRLALARASGEALEIQAFVPGSTATAATRCDGSTATAHLVLPRPAWRRSIEVLEEGGKPLPWVVATLASHGWPVAVSDATGHLSLAAGSPGAVPILLEGSDGRRLVFQLSAPAGPHGNDFDHGATLLPLPRTPAVRGRVIDGERRRGVPGALVWLSPDPGTSVLTGSGGEYALPSGGRERLHLQAEAAGFLPQAAAIGPQEASGHSPELVLQPAESVFGRVVDEDGSALDGVILKAEPEARARHLGGIEEADAPSRARSGAEGHFDLAGLRPAVAYQVVAQHPGFATLTVPGVVVAPGRSGALGTLVLKPGARLEGRVTDARGVPLAGAELRVRGAAGLPGGGEEEKSRERPPDSVTGPDGKFVVPDLRPGSPLDLLIFRAGYLPSLILGVKAPSAEPLTVVLQAASRLAGALLAENGEPVAGAQVGLRWLGPPRGTVGVEPRRASESRSAKTGAGGEFSFENLAPGGVEVFARAAGFLPGASKKLELPSAGEVTGVRLVLRRGAVVEGRVFDSRGNPVEGTRLRAGPAEAISSADGSYRLSGLPPGLLGLYAHHADYRRRVQEVDVEPGVNAVDVFLEEGLSVSGHTVDEAGDTLAGARVELRSESLGARGSEATVSGGDGRFRVVVSEEGEYRLTATREGFASREITGLEVRSAALEGVEVVLARGCSVGGRLLGLEPEDLAAVSVEARRDNQSEPEGTVAGAVDPRGRYTIPHLSPGDWRIRAVLASGRRQAEATVAIIAAIRQVERDLDLGAGLRLSGRLLYSGEPLAAAYVTLSGLDVVGKRSVLSEHDGGFRIEGLVSGRYRLDVLDPTRALSYIEDLELTSDREVVLELEAAPLVGTVTSAETSEPLEEALIYIYKLLATGERGSLITVSTDAAGGFTVAHLTAGRYLVSARKDGYTPAQQALEVMPGTPHGRVLLRLAAASGLTLAVHLESGAVPRFATVSAFDPSGRQVLSATKSLSDRGFVDFEELPPGTWNLLVSAEGAAPAWVSATVPGFVPDVVLPLAAPLSIRVPALMKSAGVGTLTLAAQGGSPFFQVEPGGALRSSWTIYTGLLTLADVPAGIWRVRVDGAHGGTWLGTVTTDGHAPSELTLE